MQPPIRARCGENRETGSMLRKVQDAMNEFNPARRRVLVTGACGKIGSYFARYAAERYDLRLVDRAAWDEARLGPLPGESLTADLQDSQACRMVCQGVDTVVHLAADADPQADFLGSLLGNNVLATYHLFQAAQQAGCRRVVYASSAHAVAAYPPDISIGELMPVRPTSLYGVSKCFGEALAAHYAVNEGLSAIAMRIGAYLFPDELEGQDPAQVSAYLHPDDFNELLVRCIEVQGVDFAIMHAVSQIPFMRLNVQETRRLLGDLSR
jgi:uronate dehydrogenase